MKFLKGCLITFIIFIGICIIGWFSFKSNVLENLESLSGKVKDNWEKYTENIIERNAEFALQQAKNDSLKYYLKNSNELIKSKEYSKELELNEYKLNRILMVNSLKSNLNEKLNLSLDNYNQAVKEYNVYRVTFPNSLIARKTKFQKFYNFELYLTKQTSLK